MDEILTNLTNVLPAKYHNTILLLLALSPLITRALYAVRTGGGLKGLLSSIWLGTNAPKSKEAQPQPENKTTQ